MSTSAVSGAVLVRAARAAFGGCVNVTASLNFYKFAVCSVTANLLGLVRRALFVRFRQRGVGERGREKSL